MAVEFIPAAYVRDMVGRIQAARLRAMRHCGAAPAAPDATYWEPLFEANAAEVLAQLPSVTLPAPYVVRYRFFGQRGGDLLVRPFVARATTDVTAVRQLLDWHAPPDSAALLHPSQDVELLYRHFSFPLTPVGFFDYWLAMQEIWGSARWAHSRVVASAEELAQIAAAADWEIVRPVQAYEPAVIHTAHNGRVAVLVHCALGRFEIALQQIDIGPDQALRYGDPVPVALGPRGYLL